MYGRFLRMLLVPNDTQGADVKQAAQDLKNEFNMQKVDMDFGMATKNARILGMNKSRKLI